MGKQRVAVIGAGSWGTALALVLARNGHSVYLWDLSREHIAALQAARSNERYLAGIPFPDGLQPVPELAACGDAGSVVLAMPCAGLQDTLTRLRETPPLDSRPICLACKGFEPLTRSLNTEVVHSILGPAPTAVLSGPSFAGEVARGLPTAITVAAEQVDTADHFSLLFHSDVFRIYTHDDVIGVQVGGAVKNVIAIAAGIADGLGFGANTRSALITRSLVEIMRLGAAMGGRQETLMGLAGLGDLILTCTDDQSRNRRFGLALAAGTDAETAKDAIGQAVEGAVTTAVVQKLAEEHRVDMPITQQVDNILRAVCTPEEAVRALLSREARPEM